MSTTRKGNDDRVAPAYESELVDLYNRCAVVRRPSRSRREKKGDSYHRGYEVRFVLPSKAAVRRARRLLTMAGFTPGAPYQKGRRIVVPVYGRDAVRWFDPERACYAD